MYVFLKKVLALLQSILMLNVNLRYIIIYNIHQWVSFIFLKLSIKFIDVEKV